MGRAAPPIARLIIRQGLLLTGALLALFAALTVLHEVANRRTELQGYLQVLTGMVAHNSEAAVMFGNGAEAAFKAGMFARGDFALGQSRGLTLPRQAVAMRDGFNHVFLVGADNRVTQAKVEVGYRDAERVEILAGMKPDARVVASGAGFLNDGDLVQVVPPSVQALAPTTR